QATVTRDIKELHLVKVPSANKKYTYSLPADQRFNALAKLNRLIMDAFVNIDHTAHFIVLKTFPGIEQDMVVLIDYLSWNEVMLIICVDDTCLIICRSEEVTKEIKERFLNML